MLTGVLIGINGIIFVVMLLLGVGVMPTGEELIRWGGMNSDLVIEGEWWRLLTSMFVHFGIIHLGMNMYFLYSFGRLVEQVVGKGIYLGIYLASGILSGIASFLFHKGKMAVSAGASGAIAGIFGTYIFILCTPIVKGQMREKLLTDVMQVLGINVLYGLIKGRGIDHAAHFGGLLSGFIMGGLFYPFFNIRKWIERVKLKWLVVGGVTAFSLFLIPTVVKGEKVSDASQFFYILEELDQEQLGIQKKFMKVDYHRDPNILCLEISKEIFPHLEKVKALKERMSSLTLNEDLDNYRQKVARYFEYYDQKLNLILTGMRLNSNFFEPQIRKLDKEMAELLPEHSN